MRETRLCKLLLMREWEEDERQRGRESAERVARCDQRSREKMREKGGRVC